MRFTLIGMPTRNTGHQIPNIGAIAIAQKVLELGHEVSVIDAVRYNYTKNQVISEVKKTNPDLIGLSGIVTSYYFYEPLSIMLKKTLPKIPLVLGGSITSALDLIEKYTETDYLVIGEGEDCISELMARFSDCRSIEDGDIPGLWVRTNGKFKSPAVQQSYPDLNKVSIPAYHLYDMDYYIDTLTDTAYRFLGYYPEVIKQVGFGIRFFPVVISRGCPYSCLFCYRLIKKYRHPEINYAISYLKMVKEKYGCSGIYILDELIITDRKWFIELCETIADEVPGLKIFFGAGRANLVTPDMMSSAKRAGFIRFGCGIESGSQSILNNLNKKTTVEQNRYAIQIAKNEGLMASCNFLFGAPGENKVTLKETEKFIREMLDPRDFAVNLATAYPGSPLWDYALKHGLLKKDEIHNYVTEASFGEYPINFSEFSSADELSRQVRMMMFRLTFRHLKKTQKYRELLILILKELLAREGYKLLKKYWPSSAKMALLFYRKVRGIKIPKE